MTSHGVGEIDDPNPPSPRPPSHLCLSALSSPPSSLSSFAPLSASVCHLPPLAYNSISSVSHLHPSPTHYGWRLSFRQVQQV